jgi:hypothetical protein
VHASSSIGRNDTEAVIWRRIAWISDCTALSGLAETCGGGSEEPALGGGKARYRVFEHFSWCF